MATKIAKKLSIATAALALTGGILGAGTAGAQELSSSEVKDQLTQLSSSIFGNKDQPAAPEEKGSELIVPLAESAQHLDTAEAAAALEGHFVAKKNSAVSLNFRPGGSADGALNFFDGCNGGSGSYHFDSAGSLRTENLNQTLKGCEPAIMADADALMTILTANPQVYRIDDNTVALASQGQSIEFVRAEG